MTSKTYEFELLVNGGKIVKWDGNTGQDAARRYADSHPSVTVYATRPPPVMIVIGPILINQGGVIESTSER